MPICRKMGDENIEILFILRYLLCFRVNVAVFMPAKIFERVLSCPYFSDSFLIDYTENAM